MDRDIFAREHLNVWADSNAYTGIDAITWAACRNDDIMPGNTIALGLDFTPERDRGALVVAGPVDVLTPDGTTDTIVAIELIESSSDLEAIVTRAAEVANTWNALITIDRGSPAASAIPALERLTMDDRRQAQSAADPAHRAGAGLRRLPRRRRLRRLSHRGDYRLTDAVTGATKRRVGESWAWSRRGHADISPLVAATLARWGVVAAPEELVPAVY